MALVRKDPKIEVDFRRVVIEPPQLKAICEAMEFDGAVRIEADHYRATSYDDLMKMDQPTIRELTIYNAGITLIFRVGPNSADLSSHGAQVDPKAYAAKERIVAVLNPRKRLPYFWRPARINFLASVLVAGLAIAATTRLGKKIDSLDWVLVLVPFLLAQLAVTVWALRAKAPDPIILKPEVWAKRGFLKKYFAEITVALAFVGSAAAVIAVFQ